jgi:hypothetical protein
MLCAILKKHDGATAMEIQPQALSPLSRFLKSSNPLRNPARFASKIKTSTYGASNKLACSKPEQKQREEALQRLTQ